MRNDRSADERLRVRRAERAPLVAELETWLRQQRSRPSRSSAVAQPPDYLLRRWPGFTHFLEDGRICLTNNAAARSLRGFALGRKAWLFAGSRRGADRAAATATLIVTAKLNDIDPQAWLAEVLTRIVHYPAQRLAELLPRHWPRSSAGFIDIPGCPALRAHLSGRACAWVLFSRPLRPPFIWRDTNFKRIETASKTGAV